MRSFLIVIFTLFVCANAYARTLEATVAMVLDGDTFVTKNSEHVRLLGINTPERAKGKNLPAEPFADEAYRFLQKVALDKKVRLETDEKERDRYGRLLAHVYLEDGTWLNKLLLEQGLAHVYTFPDNRGGIAPLLEAANKARKANKGMWTHPRWHVLNANEKFNDEMIGRFHLVKGRVRRGTTVKGIVYLNFGANWKDDFTVEIKPHDVKTFTAEGIDPVTYYTGKHILVRGILKPVNGVLVTVTHPEQIEVIR